MGVTERLEALEAGATKAGWQDFGPSAPTGGDGDDLSSMMPGEPVTADGVTPLPWNAQAGQAGRQLFRGKTDIILQPELVNGQPFTGWREVSASKVAPQFDSLSVTLDNDPTQLGGGMGGPIKVYFADGVRRVMHLTPNPGYPYDPKAPVPCGNVQFVGGIPPQ